MSTTRILIGACLALLVAMVASAAHAQAPIPSNQRAALRGPTGYQPSASDPYATVAKATALAAAAASSAAFGGDLAGLTLTDSTRAYILVGKTIRGTAFFNSTGAVGVTVGTSVDVTGNTTVTGNFLVTGTASIPTLSHAMSTAGYRITDLPTPAAGTDAARSVDITDAIGALGGSLFAGGTRNLVAVQTGNTTVTVTADAMDTSSTTKTFSLSSVNLTCDLATSGAGGLDTGSVANSTHYDIKLCTQSGINPKLVAVVAGNSLTYPSGYNTQRHACFCVTDGSAHVVTFIKTGTRHRIRWTDASNRVLVGGTDSSFAAVDASTFAPPGIRTIFLEVAASASGAGQIKVRETGATEIGILIGVENSGTWYSGIQPAGISAARSFDYLVSGSVTAYLGFWGYEDNL